MKMNLMMEREAPPPLYEKRSNGRMEEMEKLREMSGSSIQVITSQFGVNKNDTCCREVIRERYKVETAFSKACRLLDTDKS
jgi:hypothetical protein